MATTSPATYGLLGMLATRPWTGYELTQQVRRSMRFVWPVSEGHLYREQKHLVSLGWATVTEEEAGRRTRKLYEITDSGRRALADWLESVPEEPHLQIEGLLRTLYADQAGPDELAAALHATAAQSRTMLAELGDFAREYLADGGPLDMLESADGAGTASRREFRGRPMYPERLHAVALALDMTSQVLVAVHRACEAAADDVEHWDSVTSPDLTSETRGRLEQVARRGAATGRRRTPS
jgi:PadR family transcriptional regulator, regulatory protein AphA